MSLRVQRSGGVVFVVRRGRLHPPRRQLLWYADSPYRRGAHGPKLTPDSQESPIAFMDVFEDRLKLIVFYQQADAPRVVVEFGDKGEILHVEINGLPHASVVHRPA